MWVYAGLCGFLRVYAGLCWLMLVYVGLCGFMLAYVGLCWLMLAYVGLWSHISEGKLTSYEGFALTHILNVQATSY